MKLWSDAVGCEVRDIVLSASNFFRERKRQAMERVVRRINWLGKAWKFFKTTTSTQDEARRWVLEGAPHGALVIADHQTQGRGRFGRSWFSPPNKNLYFTAALQLPTPSPSPSTLSLMAGVAVAEALRICFNAQIFVKWSNDVVAADGKKLAGILVEGFKDRSGLNWALVGIGINVNLTENDLPDDLRASATSLQVLLGKRLDRFEVLAAILVSLEAWWEVWVRNDLERVLGVFRELDWLDGKRVRVVLSNGVSYEGTACGVTESGCLRLKLRDGSERTFIAGEATVSFGE